MSRSPHFPPPKLRTRLRSLGGLILALAIAASLTVTRGEPAAATHAPPPITEFAIPGTVDGPAYSNPSSITTGPDGNLWFTESRGNRIGRITPTGAMTFWDIPTPESYPGNITSGPDGALWFTEYLGEKIGRMTTAGVFTEYPLPRGTEPSGAGPAGLTTGPDGNLWYTDQHRDVIGRMTPAGVITEYPLPPMFTPEGYRVTKAPLRITTGPDGNLWFAEYLADQIGRITPQGVITEYPLPESNEPTGPGPSDVTAGPDGNVWFTEREAGKIGRITPLGVITEYPVNRETALVSSITTGPDGNLWFTDVAYEDDRIGVMTTAGAVTSYFVPTRQSNPASIITGPDGNIWFTEIDADAIGRAIIDRSAPTANPPTARAALNWALGEASVPMRVSWSGTDVGTGIQRYGLEMSTDGGAFTSIPLPSASATSVVRYLPPAHNHRFRVRAQDRAHNWGAWAYGPAFTLSAHQETSGAIAYGGAWTRRANTNAYGGYTKFSTQAGASATFSFTGRHVAWVAPRAPGSGIATVYVDGRHVATVDLDSGVREPRRVVFWWSWTAPGPHTVEVRVTGTSGRPRIDVDAFVTTS